MKIKVGTIIRTIALALSLISVLLTTGLQYFPELKWLSTACVIVSGITAWWKNNSFTEAAIKADELLAQLKEDETADGGESENVG